MDKRKEWLRFGVTFIYQHDWAKKCSEWENIVYDFAFVLPLDVSIWISRVDKSLSYQCLLNVFVAAIEQKAERGTISSHG